MGKLEPSPLLAELAATDDPPAELKQYLARLQQAGAIEVYVAKRTDTGAIIELSTVEQAGAPECLLVARGRRFMASWEVDWSTTSPTPVRDALDRLVDEFQKFDKIARFRFAAKDMQIVAHAASALIEAEKFSGPVRAYARVVETGMVVTYARPFLPSNEAGIGGKWRPNDEDERALHDELMELRNEYYAHASHAPQRSLAIMSGFSERPILAESWTELPVWKLELLEKMATRLAEQFKEEADRLDLELFGPREDD